MKRSLLSLLGMVLATAACWAFQGFARVSSVDPDTGKAGDAVSAKGESLDKSKVGELYFTDGKNDTKATITDQSDTEIKFKVPKMAAGRYRLMLLTAKKDSMIEQPVIFTIE